LTRARVGTGWSARVFRAGLWAGVAAPVVYYGTQLAAAPFYPGYSFTTQMASDLGSGSSTMPAVFNGGTFLGAFVMGVAALALPAAIREAGGRRLVGWLVGISVLGGALGGLNAALYPLPDPRHGSSPLAMIGGILFTFSPILFPIALWRLPDASGLRRYLVANLVVFPILTVLMIGGPGLPGIGGALDGVGGLLQRLGSATVFLPVGICSFALLRRRRRG